jgi:hypothetical protein
MSYAPEYILAHRISSSAYFGNCGVGLAGVFRTISEIWVDGVPGGKFGIGGSR